MPSSDKNLIKKLYYESFDKDEKFPFWLLKKCSKEKNEKFNVIDNKDKVIGFQYIIEYDDIAYLMYFVIEKKQRNNGYGSEILKELNRSYKNVLLCNNSNLNITKEVLEKRYTMMTSSKMLRFIMSKIFNVYDIKLK